MSESNSQKATSLDAAPVSLDAVPIESVLDTFEVSTTENVSQPVEQLLAQYVQSQSADQVAGDFAAVTPAAANLAEESILCHQQAVDPVPEASQPSEPQNASASKTESKSKEAAQPATFADLPLSKQVKQAVQNAGYETPTAVQSEIIPVMLEGRDLLAQSQTGTGKTAAFALPILSRIKKAKGRPQVLVLAPTRELAIQVAKSFQTYASCLPDFRAVAIYGGQDYEPQLRQLRRGVQVVVGTPGRVIDHINRGTLDLSGINCLVLDEADEMLNMGFLEDVQFVLQRTPDQRQIALFSATLPAPIRNIAQEYLDDPVKIIIKKKTMTADSIRQRALFVTPRDKINVLTRILEAEETDGVIVFTKTKDATVSVAEKLTREGLNAVALNGDMPQKVRERTIEQLKSGRLDILVATDVAARGLDVTRISHVFNFDLPHDSESYIHRVGRTGRAGRKGEAIIFLSNAQRGKLRLIERATKQPIEVVQPPTVDDINAARVLRFNARITDMIAKQDLTLFKELIAAYAEETGKPIEIIAAAMAQIAQSGRPFLMKDRPKHSKRDRDHDSQRDGRGRRERFDRSESNEYSQRPRREERGKGEGRRLGPPEHGMTRYRIEVGRNDGVKPGNIVGAVANEAGIDGDFIGPIKIHDSYSTIDLPEGMPRDIFQTLRNTWVSGKQLQLRTAGEEGGQSGPRRGKPHRKDKQRGPKSKGGKGFARGKSAHAGKHKKRKTKVKA